MHKESNRNQRAGHAASMAEREDPTSPSAKVPRAISPPALTSVWTNHTVVSYARTSTLPLVSCNNRGFCLYGTQPSLLSL